MSDNRGEKIKSNLSFLMEEFAMTPAEPSWFRELEIISSVLRQSTSDFGCCFGPREILTRFNVILLPAAIDTAPDTKN